jgi:H+-translocating NAD(P) transhydrogenase subunit alpha
MKIGVPREKRQDESRVAVTPEVVKKLKKKGFTVLVETSAGEAAGYADRDFVFEGAEVVSAQAALSADIVFKICRPAQDEVAAMKQGAVLICLMEPYRTDGLVEGLAKAGVNAISLEMVPRTSRAQAVDVLSSQANIAGYRAVIEAAYHYRRFLPLMMTSAGSAKAARVFVLGAGVAGLQAIATAKRLGSVVEAYDVRPEVAEQISSLGGKVFQFELSESGAGKGGYAQELSAEAKAKLQTALSERLMKCDIIISTANVPGRKAPTLISEEVVKGMRQGSVIVDMAAASGGNCPLTESDRIVVKHGVTLIGLTNFPALVAADASSFYSRNVFSLLSMMVKEGEPGGKLELFYEDDIVAAALVTYQGSVRLQRSS